MRVKNSRIKSRPVWRNRLFCLSVFLFTCPVCAGPFRCDQNQLGIYSACYNLLAGLCVLPSAQSVGFASISLHMNSALPPIPAKRYFSIGEVAALCSVKAHVLRYWEQEFAQLRPLKRRGNRRYYQHHEVLMIRKIRELLYDQGFTIIGARNQLTELTAIKPRTPGGVADEVLAPWDAHAALLPDDLHLQVSPRVPDPLMGLPHFLPSSAQWVRHELLQIRALLGSEST
jgi:DNA-binding transcriptional MerR regulator